MDTLHTVLNRGCSIWDRSLVPEGEFQKRLERIRKGMLERSLELMLVYGDSWKFGNLAYVSHFMPKNRGALAIIPYTGEPALVIQEPSRNNPFSRTLTWISDVVSVGGFMQGLSQVLKARGLQPKRVGLVTVKEQLGAKQWSGLMQGLEGVEMVQCGELLAFLRLTKIPREVALVKKATEILTRAFSILTNELRPQRKEYEVMALAERAARSHGAEDFRFFMARSSQPEIGLRPAGPLEVSQGEAISVSMAMSYQRYWAEIGQTFFLGKPDKNTIDSHGLAQKLFLRLTDGIKPGVKSADVRSWLDEALPFPAAKESALAYGVGNGVGLELVENPLLTESDENAIREGMLLTLRVCLQGKAGGTALIAHPYQVTSGGLKPLVEARTEPVFL
ncbi:MAG: M24 family metallopeptidase [Candidatus Binatia bacterium]